MSGSRDPAETAESQDQVLARILEEITQAVEAGTPVDVAGYEARYPEYADRIRGLVPAVQVLGDLGISCTQSALSRPAATVPHSPSPGVLGDFRLLREIGRGGMGVVYEAQQISLGRRVALKVLPFAAMLDSRQLVRFQNEARAAATLDHPNIVSIHSVGCERGVHYYAMQYIEGRTLAQVIEAMRASFPLPRAGEAISSPLPRAGEGSGVRVAADVRVSSTECQVPSSEDATPQPPPDTPYSVLGTPPSPEPPDTDRQPQAAISTKGPHQSAKFFRTVAQLGIQAAEALDHAHQSGVVHRDIKPSNLMVDGQGHLWITDFGLAMTQADPAITATGDVLGTLRYMSPEQSQGDRRRMDHRTDIYSLGVTLYELVTLQPAFPGDDRETVLRQLSEEDPPSPRRLNASVPKDLETIILKAMAKEPEQRYATAQELADDLARFLANEPIRARRPSLRRRLGLWARRHRPLVAAGVTAVAIVTLVLAIGFVRWEQERAALVELVGVVGEDLEQVTVAIDEDRLPDARQALERAEGRLAAGGPGWLIAQAEDQRRDLEMVASLDRAKLAAVAAARDLEMVASLGQAKLAVAAGGYEGWDWRGSDRAYAAAFASYGLDVPTLNREEAVRRLQDSAIRKHLVSALDHWAYVRSKLPGQSGAALGALAQDADDHPWRREVREARLSKDQQALHRLAEAPEALDQPPINLYLLARSFDETPKGKQGAEKLSRRSQQRYPGDFWLNFQLGSSLHEKSRSPAERAEGTGFVRAALALRPASPVVHVNLGDALSRQGKLAEAIEEYRLALRIDPNFALAHSDMGVALRDQGKVAEAIEEYRAAIKIDPNFAGDHSNLGVALCDEGKVAEAIEEYRLALRIDPNFAFAHNNLGAALYKQGKVAEAIDEFRVAFKIDPNFGGAHSNLGVAMRDQGKVAEAIEEHRAAIKIDPDCAFAHNNLGDALRNQGKLAEAIEECRLAIKLNPNLAKAHVNLGVALKDQGNVAEAIEEYRLAIEIDPEYAGAHNNLGVALTNQGKVAEAIEEYRAAVKIDPGDAEAHYNLGNVLYHQRKLAEAIEEYRQAINLKPDDAEAHSNLGNVLCHQRKLPEAIEEYRLAIKLKPDCVEAHNNLGSVLHDQRKLAEATEEFRLAIKLKPDLAEAHDNLGNALKHQGKVAEATEEYRLAIKLKPDSVEAHNNLGNVLDDQDKAAEAIEEFRLAIKLKPDLAEAHYNLGNVLYHQRKVAEAIEEYRQAVKLAPNDADAHGSLGAALAAQGKPAEAIEEYRLAIKLDPDCANAHSSLGVAAIALGNRAEAIQEFRLALKIKPDDAAGHSNLGIALRDQGKLAEAIEECRLAIKLKPDLAEAHVNLGCVFHDQGKAAEAIEEFRQAIKLKPNEARIHYELGNVLYDQRKLAEAIEEYRLAIKLKPDDAEAHNKLGCVLEDQDKPAEAIEEYRLAIKLKPDYVEAHFNLGTALAEQRKLAEAIEEYRLAIKLKPDHVAAHDNLGNVLYDQGKLAEAIQEHRLAIKLKPDFAGAHNNLAWQLATAADPKPRDPAEAVRLAQRAVELAPTDGGYWNTLGVAQCRAGNWKAAIEALDKSIKLNSGAGARDWFFLAIAHWQLANQEEARRWYDKAAEWTAKNQPKDEELLRFRAEAAELLGISVKPPAAKESTETKPKVEGGKGK